MTVIAAARVGDVTAMAADSATTNKNCGDQYWIQEPKIIRRGPLLLGLSGDQNLCQRVEFDWQPPDESRLDPELFVYRHVAQSIQALFQDKHPGALVAFDSSIYRIYPSGSFSSFVGGFGASGSGAIVAMVAMDALSGHGLSAPEVARSAAELAIKYTDTCAGPVQVEIL